MCSAILSSLFLGLVLFSLLVPVVLAVVSFFTGLFYSLLILGVNFLVVLCCASFLCMMLPFVCFACMLLIATLLWDLFFNSILALPFQRPCAETWPFRLLCQWYVEGDYSCFNPSFLLLLCCGYMEISSSNLFQLHLEQIWWSVGLPRRPGWMCLSLDFICVGLWHRSFFFFWPLCFAVYLSLRSQAASIRSNPRTLGLSLPGSPAPLPAIS